MLIKPHSSSHGHKNIFSEQRMAKESLDSGHKYIGYVLEKKIVVERIGKEGQDINKQYSRISKEISKDCLACIEGFLDLKTLKLHMKEHLEKICNFDKNPSKGHPKLEKASNNSSLRPVGGESPLNRPGKKTDVDKGNVFKKNHVGLNLPRMLEKQKVVFSGKVQVFYCELCDKSFAQRNRLNRHMRAHLDERKFVCTICNKRFLEKSGLQKHELCHKEEKPYSCSHCGMAFARLKGLRSHLFTHQGEKKFLCQICGRSFLRNGSLQRHIPIHDKQILKKRKTVATQTCVKDISQKEGDLRKNDCSHKTVSSEGKSLLNNACDMTTSQTRSIEQHASSPEKKIILLPLDKNSSKTSPKAEAIITIKNGVITCTF